MHGSVLQNEKYIKFSEENTVEVLALGRLDEAIQKNDKRAGTYKAKDEAGNEVEYMVEWPGLTARQIADLNSSKAGSYNNTGAIPYTAIVNPHTLEEVTNFRGGTGAGSIMDAVTEHKKALNKQYGPSLSRKVLDDIAKQEASIRKDLGTGDVLKAMSTYNAMAKKSEKLPDAIKQRVAKSQEEILTVAGTQLDELEGQLSGDQAKQAAGKLDKLARALKGTPLEQRAADLLAKAKEPGEAAK